MLNLSGDIADEDWADEFFVKNADKIKEALAGGDGAQAAVDDLKASVGDLILESNGLSELSDNLNDAFNNLDVGAFVDAGDEMMKGLTEAYEAGKIGYDDLCDYLASKDMTGVFDYATPIGEAWDEAAQVAAEGAANAADAGAQAGGIDTEVVEGEAPTESKFENVGFDEQIDLVPVPAVAQVLQNGASEAQPVELMYYEAHKSVNPEVVDETAESENKVAAPKLIGATKPVEEISLEVVVVEEAAVASLPELLFLLWMVLKILKI